MEHGKYTMDFQKTMKTIYGLLWLFAEYSRGSIRFENNTKQLGYSTEILYSRNANHSIF